MSPMKTSRLLAAIAMPLLSSTTSWANITFFVGNFPQPGEENALLSSGAIDSSIVIGTLNQSGFLVDFTSTSGSGLLSEPSSGIARIEGGTGNSPLGKVSFSLDNG